MNRTPLDTAFNYHAPKGNQTSRYEAIRAEGKRLGGVILQACPEGPEKDQAIMLVRQACMMANASIACGEANGPGVKPFDATQFDLP